MQLTTFPTFIQYQYRAKSISKRSALLSLQTPKG